MPLKILLFILLILFLHTNYAKTPTPIRPSIYIDLIRKDDPLTEEVLSEHIITDYQKFSKLVEKIIKTPSWLFPNNGAKYYFFPILYPSRDSGYNYGLRFFMYKLNKDNSSVSLLAQLWFSEFGRRRHELKLKLENLWDKLSFEFKFRYEVRVTCRYYGLGNDSVLNEDFIDQTSSDFISKWYYYYTWDMPYFELKVRYRFFDGFSVFSGLFFSSVNVWTKYQDTRSFVFLSKPYGYSGGDFDFVKIGLLYDSRDFSVYPTGGFFSGLTFSWYGLLLDSYKFEELNFVFSYFKSAFKYFTFAFRFLGDVLIGDDIPFFAYPFFNSYERFIGLGGSDTLRGYSMMRFVDKIKTSYQFEMRSRFYEGWHFGRRIEISFVPFVDLGRVYDKISLHFSSLKLSYGLITRVIGENKFEVNFGAGFSREGVNFYLNFGEQFR